MGSTEEDVQFLNGAYAIVGIAAGLLGGVGALAGLAGYLGAGGFQS